MADKDTYFWTKNGRPEHKKNHDRNRLCRYILRDLKVKGLIMKTYHLNSDDSESFHKTISQQDLTPFVKYSLNKKRRWETKCDLETISQLEEAYCNMDVLVFDRVLLYHDPFWYLHYHNFYYYDFLLKFPIRQFYHNHSIEKYQYTSGNSTFGQSYKSLLPENRSPRKPETNKKLENDASPKVAYHIITPPKNYEKLRNNDFNPVSSFRKGHRVISHWRRTDEMLDIMLALRYEELEDLDEKLEGDYNGENYSFHSKFYNLEDHLVYRHKLSKRCWSNSNSSWSIVSGTLL